MTEATLTDAGFTDREWREMRAYVNGTENVLPRWIEKDPARHFKRMMAHLDSLDSRSPRRDAVGVDQTELIRVIAKAWASIGSLQRTLEETLEHQAVSARRFISSGEAKAIADAVLAAFQLSPPQAEGLHEQKNAFILKIVECWPEAPPSVVDWVADACIGIVLPAPSAPVEPQAEADLHGARDLIDEDHAMLDEALEIASGLDRNGAPVEPTTDSVVAEIQKRHADCEKYKLYGLEGEESHRDRATLLRLLRASRLTGKGWRPISEAPIDREIIYRANRNGFYVSSCKWREPDEGKSGGWWDDACTEFVEPTGWIDMP